MEIKISVIICTHNREAYLSKTIYSLVNQTINNRLYEIIIVDNQSTDNTKAIVLNSFKNFENIRYIYEPSLGLSNARNTGWKNAKGEYVSYIDDDAIASKNWLKHILEVFETTDPMPGAVGGRVDPIWEAAKPGWLTDNLVTSLSVLNWSKEPQYLECDKWLVGANITYPKSLLNKFGGFSCNLGRKGNRLLGSEEVYLQHQFAKEQVHYYYHPDVSVKHLIPSNRLSKIWFLQRHYWQGISNSIIICHGKLSLKNRIKNGLNRAPILYGIIKNMAENFQWHKSVPFFELICVVTHEIGFISGLLNIRNYYQIEK